MTYTLICQGVIVGLTNSFEDAERIARNVGPDTLIECPNGTVLEFVMGWYRKVGERSDLFLAVSPIEGLAVTQDGRVWTAEEVLWREG